jgi:hypothetical protein
MTQYELIPYHNYHIEFDTLDGDRMSGVLFIDLEILTAGQSPTLYRYVQSNDLIEWKNAEQKKDFETMKSLESTIDISLIARARRIISRRFS